MKFHDVTNTHDSLTHYVNFLLGFPETDTNEFSLAAKARSTNTAKYDLGLDIWRNADGWDFDDAGNSGLPESDVTMVDNTQDVTLPTSEGTILKIRRVEVMDINGDYHRLIPFDETNIATSIEEYLKTKGLPQKYRLEKNVLKLYPPPDSTIVTVSSGLKITFDREINEFTAATTTTEIGIGEPGDRLIAHMVAYEYASTRMMEKSQLLRVKIEELREKVLNHFSNRHKDAFKRIMPEYESYE